MLYTNTHKLLSVKSPHRRSAPRSTWGKSKAESTTFCREHHVLQRAPRSAESTTFCRGTTLNPPCVHTTHVHCMTRPLHGTLSSTSLHSTPDTLIPAHPPSPCRHAHLHSAHIGLVCCIVEVGQTSELLQVVRAVEHLHEKVKALLLVAGKDLRGIVQQQECQVANECQCYMPHPLTMTPPSHSQCRSKLCTDRRRS